MSVVFGNYQTMSLPRLVSDFPDAHNQFCVNATNAILHKNYAMYENAVNGKKKHTPERALGVSCSGHYGNVSYVADTSQSLATETVRCHGSQVVKATYLTRRKSLAYDLHVFSLKQSNEQLGGRKCGENAGIANK